VRSNRVVIRSIRKNIMDGLRRVEGQVRGIQRMVEEERYCVDVLNQITAARMALARLAMIVLDDHAKGCVSKAIQEKDSADQDN
jgi:CsoR family transcriptional regulator, copper-sensing transcriptional repressor